LDIPEPLETPEIPETPKDRAALTGSAGCTGEQWAKDAAFVEMAWERVHTDRLNLLRRMDGWMDGWMDG